MTTGSIQLSSSPGVCSTTHRPMLDGSAAGQLSSLSSWTKWQRLPTDDTLCRVSPIGNRCYCVLLDNDESCPTADPSNIGRPNGPIYSTGELLNMPQVN